VHQLIHGLLTVFQNAKSDVFIIGDTVEYCEGTVDLHGDDVLALVDADRSHCTPNDFLLEARNLRIVLASSPRTREDRKWVTQYCPFTELILVMEPWTIEELFLSTYVHTA
jgi:hypothetical protein